MDIRKVYYISIQQVKSILGQMTSLVPRYKLFRKEMGYNTLRNENKRQSMSWERFNQSIRETITNPILKKSPGNPTASRPIIKANPPDHELYNEVEWWLRDTKKKKRYLRWTRTCR